jgi:hypothetical protein
MSSKTRKRIDVSEHTFEYVAKNNRYPEELGDTLDRLLNLKK